MTEICLCNIPFLDVNYENVINFKNKNDMVNYFNARTNKRLNLNIRYDTSLNNITIPIPVQDLNNCNYLFFKDVTNKYYFYFVLDKQIKNTENTILYLKLDVFSTYQFDVRYLDSFIDRCHSNRWTSDNFPILNTVDENLDYGEIIQLYPSETIVKFNDSVVITSTVPLGKIQSSNGSGGGQGGVESGNCWEKGELSSKGFRFIKGFEGYAPNAYQDSGGYWTICYGVTKHGEPDIYNKLVGMSPVPEIEGAKVSYDLKNKRYGLAILDAVKSLGCNNQGQFDALLSLAYNSGNGSVTGSNSLTNAIAKNPEDESTIRPIWENFKVTSNGIPLNGLKLRRIQECNMYFNKDVEMRPIEIINGRGTVTENNGNGWLPDT